jgi:hypothetical protein
MSNRFASAKNAICECDVCGFRFRLTQLRPLVIKTKVTNILACPECWNPDQPQLQVGMWPVDDPQAIRNPRPDVSYQVSGNSGLQIDDTDGFGKNQFGYPEGGSRIFQWGWSPVGGSRLDDFLLTPNNLQLQVSIGTVTVTTT